MITNLRYSIIFDSDLKPLELPMRSAQDCLFIPPLTPSHSGLHQAWQLSAAMLISEDSARAHAVSPHEDEQQHHQQLHTHIGFDDTAFANHRAMVRQAFHDKDVAMGTSEARSQELLAYHTDRLSWRMYRTFCQLRFGYLSFLVLMIILMFSFTLLMEIFFSIFLPSARTFSTAYVIRSVIFLALLPIVLFFLSYFFEEASRFFFDAINKIDGGLPNFRLALAVVIHYWRHRSVFKARNSVAQEPHQGSQGQHHQQRQSDLDPCSPREMRSSILLSSREDPFVDPDEEEVQDEVHEWKQTLEEQEQEQDSQDTVVASAGDGDRSPVARSRWKRAGGAVMTTNLLNKMHFEGPEIGLTTFLVVDFICPVVFEVVTIVLFVLELLDTWSPPAAFFTYVRNGFWLMGVYLCIWVVCHFWSSRNPHMRLLVSHYRRKRRVLRREVKKIEREKRAEQLWLLDVGFRFYHHVGEFVNPRTWLAGRRRRHRESADAAAEQEEAAGIPIQEEDAQQQPKTGAGSFMTQQVQGIRHAHAQALARNPWHRISHGKQAWILLVFCIATAIISLFSFGLGWPLMGVCLILLSRVIQKRFPQIFGDTFRHFITAFVLLSLVFFSSTLIIGTFVKGGDFVLGPPTNATVSSAAASSSGTGTAAVKSSWSAAARTQTIEYPVCSIDYDGLTVLDLALIADAAYGSTQEIQRHALENRFNGTSLHDMDMVNHSDASQHQVWMELYLPSINMTVVAIRGTASAADALEDLHYWFGITIMQSVNVFIPFLKQLPRDFVVGLLSMKLVASFMPEPVFEPMMDHIAAVKQRVGDRLVITGHSLGGAMAAMAGAKVKTQAVSFSGPGLLYSRGRFGVEEQDVRDYVLTLKPQKDIVPQVDQLGGMVQELRCREKSPMGCHGTQTHLCELFLSCGDTRQRNWAANKQCLRYQTLPVATATQ